MSHVTSRLSAEGECVVAIAQVTAAGSVDAAWEAVATGEGVGAWFVPAVVGTAPGEEFTTRHGDFGDSHGTLTAFEAPHRLAYVENEPELPEWHTEVTVEALPAGPDGAEQVRVTLTSGFPEDGAAHADVVESTLPGWHGALTNLGEYLEHFAPAATSQLLVQRERTAGRGEDSPAAAASGLAGEPGTVAEAVVGGTGEESASVRVAGTVLACEDDVVSLRLTDPCPGLLEVGEFTYGDSRHVMVRGYLYGEEGAAALAPLTAAWQEWVDARCG
ncbi:MULTISPECIES: SRPBCC family protein [Brevibacterium]|uniref:SRPBCC domain-containing protein n=1 Tax=Brevibacterium salitolerans TaxID=1403566 RepID=A0ABN2WC26_9MICO|nr:SRPBCC domain-containing protein [Brevibacterium sp.]